MNYAEIDLNGYGPRDTKIIKDNPGKSIYELTLLGLSKKANEKLQLVKVPVPQSEVKAQPVEVKQVPIATLPTKPKLEPLQSRATNTKGVKVLNHSTGLTQTLSEFAAKRLLKQGDKYSRVS